MCGVNCAQRMLKTRNRRHLPECIPRLFGVDNVDTVAFEELVRQAREPKADRPKAQLIPARRSPRFAVGFAALWPRSVLMLMLFGAGAR